MASGTLIAESLRIGATLGGVPLAIHEIERVAPDNLSPQQRAAGIPDRWTLLRFAVPDTDAERFAGLLAEALDPFGWYVDFHTAGETFVVFAGRMFRYAMDDGAGRAEAEAHARACGVPDAQIDWP